MGQERDDGKGTETEDSGELPCPARSGQREGRELPRRAATREGVDLLHPPSSTTTIPTSEDRQLSQPAATMARRRVQASSEESDQEESVVRPAASTSRARSRSTRATNGAAMDIDDEDAKVDQLEDDDEEEEQANEDGSGDVEMEDVEEAPRRAGSNRNGREASAARRRQRPEGEGEDEDDDEDGEDLVQRPTGTFLAERDEAGYVALLDQRQKAKEHGAATCPARSSASPARTSSPTTPSPSVPARVSTSSSDRTEPAKAPSSAPSLSVSASSLPYVHRGFLASVPVLSREQVLGRATDVSRYCKTGTDEGWVEIELKGRQGQPNPVIRRHINALNDQSTYKLNGAASSSFTSGNR